MKTKKAPDKLKATPFKELPAINKVLMKKTIGSITHQGWEIKNFTRGMDYHSTNYSSLVKSVESCLHNRIKSQDTELLTHDVTIMATHGWEIRKSPSFAYLAIEAISKRLEVPFYKYFSCKR